MKAARRPDEEARALSVRRASRCWPPPGRRGRAAVGGVRATAEMPDDGGSRHGAGLTRVVG